MADVLQLQDFDLYTKGEVIQFPNGEQILRRKPLAYKNQEPDEYHTVIAGETLTNIAYERYKHLTDNAPKYWKYIADVNGIINPLDISSYVGKQIVIPDFKLAKLSE